MIWGFKSQKTIWTPRETIATLQSVSVDKQSIFPSRKYSRKCCCRERCSSNSLCRCSANGAALLHIIQAQRWWYWDDGSNSSSSGTGEPGMSAVVALAVLLDQAAAAETGWCQRRSYPLASQQNRLGCSSSCCMFACMPSRRGHGTVRADVDYFADLCRRARVGSGAAPAAAQCTPYGSAPAGTEARPCRSPWRACTSAWSARPAAPSCTAYPLSTTPWTAST